MKSKSNESLTETQLPFKMDEDFGSWVLIVPKYPNKEEARRLLDLLNLFQEQTQHYPGNLVIETYTDARSPILRRLKGTLDYS